jgi:hypothetical protein
MSPESLTYGRLFDTRFELSPPDLTIDTACPHNLSTFIVPDV